LGIQATKDGDDPATIAEGQFEAAVGDGLDHKSAKGRPAHVGFRAQDHVLQGSVLCKGAATPGLNKVGGIMIKAAGDDQAGGNVYLSDSNFRLFIPDNLEILSEKRSE
jgi:hypothetical protein